MNRSVIVRFNVSYGEMSYNNGKMDVIKRMH